MNEHIKNEYERCNFLRSKEECWLLKLSLRFANVLPFGVCVCAMENCVRVSKYLREKMERTYKVNRASFSDEISSVSGIFSDVTQQRHNQKRKCQKQINIVHLFNLAACHPPNYYTFKPNHGQTFRFAITAGFNDELFFPTIRPFSGCKCALGSKWNRHPSVSKIETLIFEWNLSRTMICTNISGAQKISARMFHSVFLLFFRCTKTMCFSNKHKHEGSLIRHDFGIYPKQCVFLPLSTFHRNK